MKFTERLRYLFNLQRKDSEARIVSSINQVGQAVGTPANYEGFARQGYQKNVLVYRCVSKIAQACSGIEWCLYSKRKGGEAVEIESHPLLDLLKRPNPMMGQGQFMEALIGFYKLTGNTYMEAVRPSPKTPPLELWPIRPDRMKIIPNAHGYPAQYVYSFQGHSKKWDVDMVKMISDVLHIKTFNPTNDWYGQSPLEAALDSMDQNNAASQWNLSLLKNSATPSGILTVESTDGNPRATLEDQQFTKLQESIEEKYSGSRNAGRPMLLEGGLKWQQISVSPKDMEFLNNKNMTALDIAMAYGIPGELLGLGQKTFNNYREAKAYFYTETILPLMDLIADELNRWLVPAFGDDLYLAYDEDDIEALTFIREQKFTMMKDVQFLTLNEKRDFVGYEEDDGCDVYVIGNQVAEDPSTLDPANAPEPTDGVDENGNPIDPNESDPNSDSGSPDDRNGDNALNSEDPKPKPKPKKPVDDGKSWKSVNLLNRNEKKQSWRKQNARKLQLEKAFKADIKKDLHEMNKKIAGAYLPHDLRLSEFNMVKAANDYAPIIKATLKKHIKESIEVFAGTIFGDFKHQGLIDKETKASRKFDSFVNDYVERRAGQSVTHIEGTTHKQVRRIVQDAVGIALEDGETNPDLEQVLLDNLDGLSEGRAQTIARTETHNASTNGALEAVKSLGIPNMTKEWVTAEDGRVRDGDHGGADHEAMDGVVIDLEEKFHVPPDADMDAPGDGSAAADQVINCRCVLVYKTALRSDDGE